MFVDYSKTNFRSGIQYPAASKALLAFARKIVVSLRMMLLMGAWPPPQIGTVPDGVVAAGVLRLRRPGSITWTGASPAYG